MSAAAPTDQHPSSDGLLRRGWPVFLIGCHRSGTTLARYLLDAHPRLACPPESKFIAGLDAFVRYPQALVALQSMGVTREEILGHLRTLIEAVMATPARAQGKARWIDKTPNYYRLLPLIDEIFQRRVLYLFMVRHPLDTIDSLLGMNDFAIAAPEDPEIAAARRRYGRGRACWAHYWVDVNATAHGFLSAVSDRCHTFRYEDVVRTPAVVLSGVTAFLGEEFAPQMIEGAFAYGSRPGYQDWKIRGATAIHERSVGRWRSWPRHQVRSAWKIVAETAITLGYPSPLGRPARRLRPAAAGLPAVPSSPHGAPVTG